MIELQIAYRNWRKAENTLERAYRRRERETSPTSYQMLRLTAAVMYANYLKAKAETSIE